MSRIELDEEIEAEQYATKALERLKMPSQAHFQVKPASNLDHAKRTALADEIHKSFGLPIPRLMKLITNKGYQFCLQTFHEVQKSQARTPAALFLWKLKECKIELKEI